ncbi:MAG: hypothetical protein CM1200mP38_3780 [Dehalococcoidia bacterium]|nr:MAG: hypothetical protein CM1200mP38_3780 [Dehalococcoidia bacterium]
MYADLQNGKPLEIDVITGAISNPQKKLMLIPQLTILFSVAYRFMINVQEEVIFPRIERY